MASLRILKRRIRSTSNTQQIMRAMQLVSGSKFKRALSRLLEARGVLGFLDGLLQRVLSATPALTHPLAEVREAGPSALVVFTSDAGLCGSYNTNLIQLAEAYLRRDASDETQVIYIGKKGHSYFTKRGFSATASYLDLAGRPHLQKIEAVGRELMERFLSGGVNSVKLLYSSFVSSMVFKPTILPWLPIQLESSQESKNSRGTTVSDYIFEPDAAAVFKALLPRWALAKFRLVMLEAFTSEHSARMVAMKNATDNAAVLIEELTRKRNRLRQAAITTEISEIVGTAEALK